AGTVSDGSATFTFAAMANLTGGAAPDTFTGTGTWTGKLDGGPGLDTLAGDNNNHAWIIASSNAGTLDGRPFANVENLRGGAGLDNFTLNAGQKVAGRIDGGAGSDVLD